MGYHYVIDSASFPDAASDKLELTLKIDNVGCAPCYKPLPLVLRLTGNGKNYEFPQSCDIRRWLPGKHSETLSASLEDIPAGTYAIEIGIISPHADVLYFATNAPRNGGFYEIGNIVIK